MVASSYLHVRFRVPAAVHDAFVADLWQHQPLGLELGSSTQDPDQIDGYFRRDGAPVLSEHWRRLGAEIEIQRVVEDEDWLAVYRRAARPVAVGRSFLVDPREPDAPAERVSGERRLLRIPARRAFGTGSHESTRLAVSILETLDLEGRSVLDVGCGTGILAFVSLLLGATPVFGFDVDPQAGVAARDNARLNGLRARWAVGDERLLSGGCRFGVVVVNVLPGHVLGSFKRLAESVEPGGDFVYSGALARESGRVEEATSAAGLEIVEWTSESGWIACRCRGEAS